MSVLQLLVLVLVLVQVQHATTHYWAAASLSLRAECCVLSAEC